MNYVIQCRDRKTGKIGTFLIDPDKPRWNFKRGEYDAESPVFDNLVDFLDWLSKHNIAIHN